MGDRVNRFAGWRLGPFGALSAGWLVASAIGCGTHRIRDDGGSRVDIIWLDGRQHRTRKPPAVVLGGRHERHGELGDGTVASELLAGARRLLDLELPGGSKRFEAHLRAVALWEGAAVVGRAVRPGEVARIDGRVAVCEKVSENGDATFIGPDDDDIVRRFVVPLSDID